MKTDDFFAGIANLNVLFENWGGGKRETVQGRKLKNEEQGMSGGGIIGLTKTTPRKFKWNLVEP